MRHFWGIPIIIGCATIELMISKLPKPDPCLVSFYIGNTRKIRERDWIRARDCEYGCGSECIKNEGDK